MSLRSARFFANLSLVSLAVVMGVTLWTPAEAPAVVAVPTPEPVEVEEVVEVSTPAWTRLCKDKASADLDALIEQVASDYGIEPIVLATLVTKESTCRPDAVGGSGEIGLTQIHPKVWTVYLTERGLITEADDLYDPETNLRCSAHIISGHLKRTKGDKWKAFRRYNGSGPMARRYADHAVSLLETLR